MSFQKRLKRLQDLLKKNHCDSLLIEDKTNIYYMTGIELSSGKLLVHSQGATLFVDNRYYEQCKQCSPCSVTLLDNSPFEKMINGDVYATITSIGFDSESTSYKNFEALKKSVQNLSSERKMPITLIPLDAPIKELRSIKDASEIDALREAAILGSKGFDYACTLLKEGVSEQHVAAELEIFWKRHGSKGLAFDPIIAFGANSSMPHYRAGATKLKANDIVLIDIGVNLLHYHSDMTRMAFFGLPHPQLIEIHEVVKNAQAAALKICRPGTLVGDLDAAARSVIDRAGYKENFTHSLGHGVGLDIHELPALRNTPPANGVKLEPGMVITIEPGIYLPGLGGVRIEDTIVITQDGHENLTQRDANPVKIKVS